MVLDVVAQGIRISLAMEEIVARWRLVLGKGRPQGITTLQILPASAGQQALHASGQASEHDRQRCGRRHGFGTLLLVTTSPQPTFSRP